MSRITDTERGARIAHDISLQAILQPDLFPRDSLPLAFWIEIQSAADDVLNECAWARQATAQA